MKKIICLLLIFMLCPILHASATNLTISAYEPSVITGDSLTFLVSLDSAVDLYAYEVRLEYDSALLEYQNYSVDFSEYETMWQDENKIVVGVTKRGDTPGANGNVELLRITFKTKAVGTANVKVLDIKGLNTALVNTVSSDIKTAYATITEKTIPPVVTPPSGGGGGGGGGGFSVTPPKTTPAPQPEIPAKTEVKFNDVDDNFWGREAISHLANKGIINGNNGSFEPDRPITREEVVKMLVLAFSIDLSSDGCDFQDVDSDSWYYSYVAAANKHGIVNGISALLFGVGEYVKRQDAAVMIARILRSRGYTTDNSVHFEDEADISNYALADVLYLASLGYINGFENNFNPAGNMTRAEISQLLFNIIK